MVLLYLLWGEVRLNQRKLIPLSIQAMRGTSKTTKKYIMKKVFIMAVLSFIFVSTLMAVYVGATTKNNGAYAIAVLDIVVFFTITAVVIPKK